MIISQFIREKKSYKDEVQCTYYFMLSLSLSLSVLCTRLQATAAFCAPFSHIIKLFKRCFVLGMCARVFFSFVSPNDKNLFLGCPAFYTACMFCQSETFNSGLTVCSFFSFCFFVQGLCLAYSPSSWPRTPTRYR